MALTEPHLNVSQSCVPWIEFRSSKLKLFCRHCANPSPSNNRIHPATLSHLVHQLRHRDLHLVHLTERKHESFFFNPGLIRSESLPLHFFPSLSISSLIVDLTVTLLGQPTHPRCRPNNLLRRSLSLYRLSCLDHFILAELCNFATTPFAWR